MTLAKATLAASFAALCGAGAMAGQLQDRVDAGEAIRLGFAASPPWAYQGDDGSAMGFVNAITIGVLQKMGHENVEPVLTDWSALIPSLKAGRVDVITGGMYVLPERCANVDFSDPIGAFGDAFIVAAGNPKGIATYQDLIDQDLRMATVSGYNTVADGRAAGVADSQIMQVPGPTEMLAAVRAGRADAGATNTIEARLLSEADEQVDMTDPAGFEGRKKQVVSVGFPQDDDAFREEFNAALQEYLGSDEMMETVAVYDYIPAFLPGDLTTEDACNAG